MTFTSTRNKDLLVSFSQAVSDCIPEDGGVFVPSQIEDFRKWIYYIDESTSFNSIAGSLTSALIKNEFSPIICETIATNAFNIEPKITQLEDKLFFMELYNGYTGCHRDYGVSYLCSYLETTNQLLGKKTILLDYTNGDLGPLFAKNLKGKKNIKAVLLYKKGNIRGLEEEDFIWNGGNILPLEMEESEEKIKKVLSEIYDDKSFVKEHNLTVANTTNVCRLLAQIFFFPYSFAQIKNKINGDIFYSMGTGNYGTLMAGLYSWRLALPVSGFLIPSTSSLCANLIGEPLMMDSLINKTQREEANPVSPANLERLESFFEQNKLMMRNFVFPVNIDEKKRDNAAKELYSKYGIFADKDTARAYASIKENGQEIFDSEGSVVLMALNHPALSLDYCNAVIGRKPLIPESLQKIMNSVEINRPLVKDLKEIKELIKNL